MASGALDRGWYPGERVERLRAAHSYGFVLALVGLALSFLVAAPNDGWAWALFVLIQVAILVLAGWTSGLGRAVARPGLVLVAAASGLAAAQLLWAEQAPGVASIANAGLVLATCVVIGMGVWDQGRINAQSVIGVVTVYLLLGLLFTFAFSALATFGDGPFFAQGTDGSMADRVYFSGVTIATLGYGDLTPAATTGRMLAVGEALLGQLYLVTVVALVVGQLGPRRHDESERGE